jgi:hypothetical protein
MACPHRRRHADSRARPPDSLVLGPYVGAVIVWLFAIPLDAIALIAWLVSFRWLIKLPPS